jgi:hypothetical protein
MSKFPTPGFRESLDVIFKLCVCFHILIDPFLKVFYH